MNDTEIFNLITDVGDEYLGHTGNDYYFEMFSSTHLGGQGILTYENAEKLFNRRQKGNDRKPLCNDTYLYKSDKHEGVN